MTPQIIKFGKISCHVVVNAKSGKIAYIIYPISALAEWIVKAADEYATSIVVITGTDWDNDLTPWPAKGVPAGSPDFKGLAPEFLKLLTGQIVPDIEKRLGFTADIERTLVGVSLSGLFTLWQWPECGLFKNIATLSGSYWYEGFVDWLCKQQFGDKTGRCYMLLGDKEPKASNPTFRTVGECTEKIVAYLRQQGVNITFEMVPGNHYQYGIQRLDRAFTSLSTVIGPVNQNQDR